MTKRIEWMRRKKSSTINYFLNETERWAKEKGNIENMRTIFKFDFKWILLHFG